ncbi:MAG: hypothetical protein U9R54_02300 [Bacteroidota bacterium]|nr:hypothetical protein [Bacteroidota bacterium]
MKFDNKENLFKFNVRRYLIPIIFFPLMIVVFLTRFFEAYINFITKENFIFILAIVYVVYTVFVNVMNYCYIQYNDEDGKIILRYVSFRLFSGDRNSVEIEKEIFYNYEIVKSFFNIKEDLIFFVKTPKGIAKYPSISLSGLNKNQKRKLIESLDKYK